MAASVTLTPSAVWEALDCDGDGVTNGDETTDNTDPLDACSYLAASVTLTPSAVWEALDCDDDGNPNGSDPNPLVATAVDDYGETPALTKIEINILANDDFLPNSDPNNLGFNTITQTGGSAVGAVAFDPDTGLFSYTPDVSESDTSVTIVYQVCNTIPDPAVCATATITIKVGPDVTYIIAVDDDYSSNEIDGSTGGTVPDSNVLSNDTVNGNAATISNVVLTSTPTGPLVINEDGTISVESGTTAGVYIIEYTICEVGDPNNCDSAIVTVKVKAPDTIVVMQMVTPNNDGKNDFLWITGVESVPNNSIRIYNRWGTAVFEAQGYNNQTNIFDGRSKGRSTVKAGEVLPAGVYYYIFDYEFNGSNNTDSGYLYVSK